MQKQILLISSYIIISIAQTPAFAFKLNDNGHGGITRDALNAVSTTINGETLKFTYRAKEEIKDANFEVDHHQLTASFHFDDEALAEGSSRINSLKEQTITSALNGDGKASRKALGGALHTIQDFFAHSDQVDQGLSIPNFGVDTLTALPLSTATCNFSIVNSGSVLLPGAGLTSGYFTIPLCDPPKGKCKHGLAICPGIAKDSESHPFHLTAYNSAVAASKRYIELIINDSRMQNNPKAIKRLMDIRPMLGAVIDDTGSMGSVISAVRTAVANIVNSLTDTDNEPDKYLLERFGDPNVGAPSIYTNANDFLAAVDGISPDGGDDCPEFSMLGTYKAVQEAESDSKLFLYTDASSKDAELMSAVANLASQKRVSITTALSGNCSPYDETYFELARRTGGQVFITTRDESPSTLENFMKPLVRNDMHLVVENSFNLSGVLQTIPVPVDETISQIVFSVGMISKGSIEIRRPNGSLVQESDVDAIITSTEGAKTVTINAPTVGEWTIEVLGSGVTLVTVSAATSLYMHKFEFVNMAGRPEHQGLFPIDGYPIEKKSHIVRAVVVGINDAPRYTFRSTDGKLIDTLAMSQGDKRAATSEEYVGEAVPPAGRFLVYVDGMTAAGNKFQRVIPGQSFATTVEVQSASNLSHVQAGRTTQVAFSVTNYGPTANFSLKSIDSRNFLTSSGLTSVSLNNNESQTVIVEVTPPESTPTGTSFSVTLAASASSDFTSNSASIDLIVDQANQPNHAPTCSAAAASPSIIRSNNHKMVPVTIVGLNDGDNDVVNIVITAITQDEPVNGSGDGNTLFDATGVGKSVAQVRAERSGTGDGRVYRIAFDANDGKGGTCSGSVEVQVPHDNRISAPDSGNGYNASGKSNLWKNK